MLALLHSLAPTPFTLGPGFCLSQASALVQWLGSLAFTEMAGVRIPDAELKRVLLFCHSGACPGPGFMCKVKQNGAQKGALPGIEPGTSPTLRENHTTRPQGLSK